MNFIQRRDAYLKRKYGLSVQDFTELMESQNGVCFICGNPPQTRSLHVDHEHVKGFKNFHPEKKKRHIRGLLCFPCNKFLMSKGITLEKAERIVRYLRRYASGLVFSLLLFFLSGCCGEGTDTILCWKHTPIKTVNGTYAHRYGTTYWPVK